MYKSQKVWQLRECMNLILNSGLWISPYGYISLFLNGENFFVSTKAIALSASTVFWTSFAIICVSGVHYNKAFSLLWLHGDVNQLLPGSVQSVLVSSFSSSVSDRIFVFFSPFLGFCCIYGEWFVLCLILYFVQFCGVFFLSA